MKPLGMTHTAVSVSGLFTVMSVKKIKVIVSDLYPFTSLTREI